MTFMDDDERAVEQQILREQQARNLRRTLPTTLRPLIQLQHQNGAQNTMEFQMGKNQATNYSIRMSDN